MAKLGNKSDKGVHEMGTDEMLKAYMEDTPGQYKTEALENVLENIQQKTQIVQQKKNKEGKKQYLSMVFDNPLKGYPYNESVELKELEEELDALILSEALSKKMPIEVFAKKVGMNRQEQDWIIDNEQEDNYFNNSALPNEFFALSYPIRGGDYYFAFIGDQMTDAQVTKANNKMNDLMRKYYNEAEKKVSKIDPDDIETDKMAMIASYMWNKMSIEFEKLPDGLGAGDTMTRECLYVAIKHMCDDTEPVFEHTTMADDIIYEGKFGNMLKGMAAKIRNKLRKVKKKIKLKRKAKDFIK